MVEESELAFIRAAKPVAKGERVGSSHGNVERPRRRGETGSKSWIGLLVGGWLFVLVLVSGVALYLKDDETGDEIVRVLNEDQVLLQEGIDECQVTLAGFLRAAAPESRAKYVLQSAEMLGAMAKFYQEYSMLVTKDALDLESRGVIDTPDGKGIETVWRTEGGKVIEAVFFKEGDKWKIDWEAFVRYSDQNWPIYLSGGGDDEGEFRLLARKRVTGLNDQGSVEKLVLVAPKVGEPGDVGVPSPEIYVDPASRTGRILEAAFVRRAEGVGAYGAEADGRDPKGMVRVRVRLKRLSSGERSFELAKIIACHWLHLDEIGIESED